MPVPMLLIDGSLLRCDRCGAVAAVTGPPGFDPVADRAHWPRLACPEDCGGDLAPEALN